MFTKVFCQIKQNTLKMNPLSNSAASAYWGCFQGNLIFELYIDCKSMVQFSF